MRPVDLSRLTVRAVEAVRPIAQAKQIWILSRPGPDLTILADPVRLEQALIARRRNLAARRLSRVHRVSGQTGAA